MGRANWFSGGFICETDLSAGRKAFDHCQKITLNMLKLIYLTFVDLARQVWSLPKTIGNAFRQRQRQGVLEDLEVERLDRIRNPSKYRGKEI